MILRVPLHEADISGAMKKKQVLIRPRPQLWLVTHSDVDAAGIDRAVSAFRAFSRNG
jgi:hypothetical protein